jgi:hypothetical protein
MKLAELFDTMNKVQDKIEILCKHPIAASIEERNEWLDDNKKHLTKKAKNVRTMPLELEDSIDTLFQESKATYFRFIVAWYESGYKSFETGKLRGLLKDKNINDKARDEIRGKLDELQTIDYNSISIEDKTNYFFNLFEQIIDTINSGGNWFDLYKSSKIRGDGLVYNISHLDLFAWQLPNADPRKKNDYKTIAKIMTIFFFIEKIYKYGFGYSTNLNPFKKISALNNIISYYNYIKDGE